jgi:hypothetical protein
VTNPPPDERLTLADAAAVFAAIRAGACDRDIPELLRVASGRTVTVWSAAAAARLDPLLIDPAGVPAGGVDVGLELLVDDDDERGHDCD